MTRTYTRYSDEIVAEILERHASGESIPAICRDAHMPNTSTLAI